jgi:DNA-directed RNA polymerase specialized sigma24 family protein
VGRAISAQAFEDLYAATVRDVLAYLRRRTTRDAEDLAAEVYLVAWRRRADLPAPMLRRAWLFGVAQNLLATDRRLEQRERGLTSDLAAQPGPTRRRSGRRRSGGRRRPRRRRAPQAERS